MIDIQKPYLLYLGKARDQIAAKTAQGIFYWRPSDVVGQIKLDGCKASLQTPELSLDEAKEKGAKTFVIGGLYWDEVFSPDGVALICEAMRKGYDIASGHHKPLESIEAIKQTARETGAKLWNVRIPSGDLPKGTGEKRQGLRLLAVGTDCSIGKMYTSLALHREMVRRGMKCTYRATGQTGILIDGSGISVDAVVADFMAGVIEQLTPENDADHWDVIEGQASLFHPSYAGVTMALLHGAQPDALVLCHKPTNTHMRGLPHQSMPSIEETMKANIQHAKTVNPDPKFVGIACNTHEMNEAEAMDYMQKLEQEFGLPCEDPVRTGVSKTIDFIQEEWS